MSAGINIDYRKSEAEQGMLMNLHKKGWTEGLKLTDFEKHHESSEKAVEVRFPFSR
jgi:26S proteasome regulatory subunit N11